MNSKNALFSGINDLNFQNCGVDFVPLALDSEPEISFQESGEHSDVLPTLSSLNEFPSIMMESSEPTYVEKQNTQSKPNYIRNPETVLKTTDTGNQEISQFSYQSFNQHVFNSSAQDTYALQPTYNTGDVSSHWFYCMIVNGLAKWCPFSIKDSNKIESSYELMNRNAYENDSYVNCVSVDGGRYDVLISQHQKSAVYWEEAPMEIRRASWFYRPEDESSYLPYSETQCTVLETKYREVVSHKLWNQSFELHERAEGCLEDRFVFHSPQTIVQYRRYTDSGRSSVGEEVLKGRVVCRGVELLRNHLEAGESDRIEHVVFVIHGIGPTCDTRGRNIVDCVKAMRKVADHMLDDHFHRHDGRVEFLPVSWYDVLHSKATTIDKDLQRITLKSVQKLRQFTNSTLVDVLCYSSPRYCQTVLSSVAGEMNRLRHLFMSRNPDYDGSFSLSGHSLGAVIAFDLVQLQQPSPNLDLVVIAEPASIPPLQFELGFLFALGSPISLFLTSRGFPHLGRDFRLPCRGFFNIFHPFDPVAYRLEPMLDQDLHEERRPIVIPHHKGRKRLHIELRDNLWRVGTDIKSRLVQTLRTTWSSLHEFAASHHAGTTASDEDDEYMRSLAAQMTQQEDSRLATTEDEMRFVGALNNNKRIDYVLQEAPLESFNDYLFALGSHGCYWESEDTVLMMLREVYSSLNVTGQAKADVLQEEQLQSSLHQQQSQRPETVMAPASLHTPQTTTQSSLYNRPGSTTGQPAWTPNSSSSNVPPQQLSKPPASLMYSSVTAPMRKQDISLPPATYGLATCPDSSAPRFFQPTQQANSVPTAPPSAIHPEQQLPHTSIQPLPASLGSTKIPQQLYHPQDVNQQQFQVHLAHGNTNHSLEPYQPQNNPHFESAHFPDSSSENISFSNQDVNQYGESAHFPDSSSENISFSNQEVNQYVESAVIPDNTNQNFAVNRPVLNPDNDQDVPIFQQHREAPPLFPDSIFQGQLLVQEKSSLHNLSPFVSLHQNSSAGDTTLVHDTFSEVRLNSPQSDEVTQESAQTPHSVCTNPMVLTSERPPPIFGSIVPLMSVNSNQKSRYVSDKNLIPSGVASPGSAASVSAASISYFNPTQTRASNYFNPTASSLMPATTSDSFFDSMHHNPPVQQTSSLSQAQYNTNYLPPSLGFQESTNSDFNPQAQKNTTYLPPSSGFQESTNSDFNPQAQKNTTYLPPSSGFQESTNSDFNPQAQKNTTYLPPSSGFQESTNSDFNPQAQKNTTSLPPSSGFQESTNSDFNPQAQKNTTSLSRTSEITQSRFVPPVLLPTDNACRTPSPKLNVSSSRSSPRLPSSKLVASSTIFSSKPLIPQSGKVFKKK